METTSNNTMQIFTNTELNANIRVVEIDGQPFFVAKDVCDALELTNSRETIKRLDDDELTSVQLTSGGQMREMTAVNEFGLYNLILGSRKPEAKQFKRWITHEVLPSIRKTGSYQNPQFSKKAGCTFRIGNVEGKFDENGKPLFKLEDTARAVGLVKNKNDSDQPTYVIWHRVKKMLQRMGYLTPNQLIDKDSFIPEEVFYYLVERTRNPEARDFQSVVNDELPKKPVAHNKSFKVSVQFLVRDIRGAAEEIEKTFGVSHSVAIDRAIELKEKITGVELEMLRELIPSENSDPLF